MGNWIDDCYGCDIQKIENPTTAQVVFFITHKQTNQQLAAISLPNACRIAKLLDLEYRVCDWYNNQ